MSISHGEPISADLVSISDVPSVALAAIPNAVQAKNLVELGVTPSGLGHFMRKRGTTQADVLKSGRRLQSEERIAVLNAFRAAPSGRSLEPVLDSSASSAKNLRFFAERDHAMVLMAFLDQVERTGSVPVSTAPDQMPLLARSVNILAIPLSTLVTALKARSASPGQISRFLYALLDYWDTDRRFTETTLARQLVTLYGNDLRYVAGLGWLLWDGRHWRADVLGDMQELVKSLGSEWRADAGAIMLTLAHATDDLEYQRIFGRSRRVESLANQCEGVRKIENILKAARRIQVVSAISSASFSDGFRYPRVMRGRSLRLRANSARSLSLWTERSVPFGMYWRSSPLVFSFDPRCQGEWGSQK